MILNMKIILSNKPSCAPMNRQTSYCIVSFRKSKGDRDYVFGILFESYLCVVKTDGPVKIGSHQAVLW